MTIGTDVEGFAAVGNEIVALRPGDIDGDKADPFIINKTYDCGIQLDNVLAEVTFKPAFGGHEFEDLCALAKFDAGKYLNSKGFDPIYKSSHIFELEELNFPHAKVAGCEPDYAAIEDESVPQFNQEVFTRLRTGSGHLHFGLHGAKSLEKHDIIQYVRGLDRCLGATLCTYHSDPTRRLLYGQAGRFRFKPYGFEYRTPDNYWFAESDELALAIWDVAKEMFRIPIGDKIWDKVNEQHRELANLINLGSVPEIKTLLKSFDFPTLEV